MTSPIEEATSAATAELSDGYFITDAIVIYRAHSLDGGPEHTGWAVSKNAGAIVTAGLLNNALTLFNAIYSEDVRNV